MSGPPERSPSTILPPFITDDGDILVDGGVLDNIPVAIMRELEQQPLPPLVMSRNGRSLTGAAAMI